MNHPLRAIGLALGLAALASCGTSAASYVESLSGYSVIRGRIQSTENLSASQVDRLSDGVALTLSAPGCSVSMAFANTEIRVIELGTGTIIVYGTDQDVILQSAPGVPAH